MASSILLTADSREHFVLCDATLLGIRWEADGRDLCVDLRLGDGKLARVDCSWVGALRLDLAWPADEGGHALSWHSACEQRGSRWWMSFDFRGWGVVELECHQARLEHADA